MTDPRENSDNRRNAWAPANEGGAVTPSDTVDLPVLTRGIYVGGAGDVVVVFKNDATATFTAVPAGTLLPVAARRINSTGTTATNLTWVA